jgi:hypothetical protein
VPLKGEPPPPLRGQQLLPQRPHQAAQGPVQELSRLLRRRVGRHPRRTGEPSPRRLGSRYRLRRVSAGRFPRSRASRYRRPCGRAAPAAKDRARDGHPLVGRTRPEGSEATGRAAAWANVPGAVPQQRVLGREAQGALAHAMALRARPLGPPLAVTLGRALVRVRRGSGRPAGQRRAQEARALPVPARSRGVLRRPTGHLQVLTAFRPGPPDGVLGAPGWEGPAAGALEGARARSGRGATSRAARSSKLRHPRPTHPPRRLYPRAR